MNKTKIIIATALWGASLATISVFAYQGEPGSKNPEPTDQERHSQVQTMFENSDYQSFQELFENKWPSRKIDSEEDFNKFVELRKARENNDTEKAENLAEELNLGQWNGHKGWNEEKRHSKNGKNMENCPYSSN